MLADYIGGDLWLLAGSFNKLMTYCAGREMNDRDVGDNQLCP